MRGYVSALFCLLLFGDGRTSAHDGALLCTGNCTECAKKVNCVLVLKSVFHHILFIR